MKRAMAMLVALFGASAAWASDDKPCPAGLICATKPDGVAEAVRAAGFSAELTKTDKGASVIRSSASGYKYNIYFVDCDEAKAKCAALQFFIDFRKDGTETLDLVNRWNRENRMGKAYLEDDGGFAMEYDFSTIGGITPANMKDVMLWWESTLGQLNRFFKETTPAPAAKPGA